MATESMDYREVLECWFGEADRISTVIGRQSGLWWGRDPAVDADLRRRFAGDVQALLAMESVPAGLPPEERLAAIILADQVTRSIHRDSAAAFAGDDLALALCEEGLERGQDRELGLLQRVFFYMPLEHAESLPRQERCVALFEGLLAEAGPELEQTFRRYRDFALRHRDIIARFGRFPHRNRLLGRDSTPEEAAFLREPGSAF